MRANADTALAFSNRLSIKGIIIFDKFEGRKVLLTVTHSTMNWFLYKLMHEGGDGRVEDERYEEEESEDTDNTESPQEHGGVVFDFF